MKNLLSIIIMALILWLFIFYSIEAFAIPVHSINFEGPNGLTRRQALTVQAGGHAEWNSLYRKKKLKTRRFKSLFNTKFAYPTLKEFKKHWYRVRTYILRWRKRTGKKIVHSVYMPAMFDNGYWFAGLGAKGSWHKNPDSAIALVFGRELSDKGTYRIPLLSKVLEHEYGHVICNLDDDNENTFPGCLMNSRFSDAQLPQWCEHEYQGCLNRFKVVRYWKRYGKY